MKLFGQPPLRLRLLAPAVALIVAATMIPVGLRHPSLRFISNEVGLPDVINNIILYMPLGIALSGTSLLRAFLFGLFLATGAEVWQLGCIDRIPSFVDVAGNTCGAVVGYLAAAVFARATGHDPKTLWISRPLAAAAIPVALLGTILLVHHSTVSDLSNWSPAFHLAIGDELNGDRPWAGTVSRLAIYPFAMSPAQIDDLAAPTEPPLTEPPILDLAPPAGLSGHPLLPRPEELKLYQTLVGRNQFTLVVAMRPSNVEQTGPARIVTYSRDAFGRNFTLGQINKTLTFRLRTPASGSNGVDPALYTGAVLLANHTSLVAAVYDGRISRLYVDGKPVAQVDLGAKRPRLGGHMLSWLPGAIPVREIELGGAEMLLGGLFSLGIFALIGVPGGLSMRLLAGVAAGVAIGGTIWVFGVSEARLGTRILLECVAASLVIAASIES
jgi:hypothetical protein